MKKTFFLVVVLSILLCGYAMAAEQIFDTKVGKFRVEVPANWTAKAISDGCQITDGEKNMMTIQFLAAKNMSSQTFAKIFAEAAGMKVKNDKTEGDVTWLEGDIKGVPFGILSAKKGEKILVSSWGGKDRAAMKGIFETVKGVNADSKESTLDLEAGPIWNNEHAKERCPEVLKSWLKANPDKDAEWTGGWSTTVQGKMSVCTVKVKNK